MEEEPNEPRTARGDAYESQFMAGEGHVLARDKFVSRSMTTILGLATLGLVAGAVGFALAGIWPAAAIMGGLSPVFALLTLVFPVVRAVVTADEVHVQYGLWGPRVPIDSITECVAERYDWNKYGGWGIRRSRHDDSWAYVPSGAKDVVALSWTEDGKTRRTLFAASDPRGTVAAIQRVRAARRLRIDPAAAEVGAEVDAAALAEAEAAVAEELAEEEKANEAEKHGT